MKTALIASAFLFLALPVHAQDRASQLTFGGGGGAGFGGAGFSAASIGRSALSLAATSRSEHYTYTYAQGSAATYTPTRFVSFETGLKLAKETPVYRPKSLGEIAAEYRAAKRQTR